jgi:1-acyl-sn-glycerol-3-phosphate acyltransferase
MEIEGEENLDQVIDGPFLLCPNHTSSMDLLLSLYLGVRLTRGRSTRYHLCGAAAMEHLTNPWFKQLALYVGAISVDRSLGLQQEAFEEMGYYLKGEKKQGAVLLYPEGTRSKTGKMAPMKSGAAWIQAQYKVPVIPVYHRGFDKLPGIGKKLKVIVGKPISAPENPAKWDAKAKELSNILMAMEKRVLKEEASKLPEPEKLLTGICPVYQYHDLKTLAQVLKDTDIPVFQNIESSDFIEGCENSAARYHYIGGNKEKEENALNLMKSRNIKLQMFSGYRQKTDALKQHRASQKDADISMICLVDSMEQVATLSGFSPNSNSASEDYLFDAVAVDLSSPRGWFLLRHVCSIRDRYNLPVKIGTVGGVVDYAGANALSAAGAEFVYLGDASIMLGGSGLSSPVKNWLKALTPGDFATAPMWEWADMEKEVPVIRSRTLFPARMKRLGAWCRLNPNSDEYPAAILGESSFASDFKDGVMNVLKDNIPEQASQGYKAEMLLRWYLFDSIVNLVEASTQKRPDFQLRLSPEIALFNGVFSEDIKAEQFFEPFGYSL